MASEIELRPGVVFRTDAAGEGGIEFAKGRRFDNVSFLGTIPGKADTGARAHVNILSAIFPSAPDKVLKWEHLPVMVVVAVETQYLATDSDVLPALFFLERTVDGGPIDPKRTVVLALHGCVEVGRDDQLVGGNLTLPSVRPNRSIYLDARGTATMVRRVRDANGRHVTAVVNTACFSSTRSARSGGTTFNEELAALLAEDGVAVYGPPHAGVVTAATWQGHWRAFGQRVEKDSTLYDVPIAFQRIGAAPCGRMREMPVRKRPAALYGSVVVTNDLALAREVCSFGPEFSEVRSHAIDRRLME
jgi:hypothetical protein